VALLFTFTVMAVCLAIFLVLTEGVVSVCRNKPRSLPLRQPSLVLIQADERRAQRLRFVGMDRRSPHPAAIQATEAERKIA
jgi:hypothetical protein